MATTVIDALVVEVGLDPAKYKKGLTDALAAAAKGKDQLIKGGKDIEASGKGMDAMFSKLRNNVLGLAALFTGGLGLKAFIESNTQANISLGRLNQITGISVRELGAWSAAGRMAGGTTSSFTNIFKTLTMEMAKFNVTGTSEMIPLFRALGIDIVKITDGFKDFSQVIPEITKAVEQGRGTPAERAFLLQQLGVDEAGISAILKGQKVIQHFYEEGKKFTNRTEADIKAANDLTEAFWKMVSASESAGNAIQTKVTPALVGAFDAMANLTHLMTTGELGQSDAPWKSGSNAETVKKMENFWMGIFGGIGAVGRWFTDPRGVIQKIIDAQSTFDDRFSGVGGAETRTAPSPRRSGGPTSDRWSGDWVMPDGTVLPGSQSSVTPSAGIAAGAGVAASRVDNSRRTTNTSTSDVKIGTVNVHTQATDARGIARDFSKEVGNTSFATQANQGPI